MKLRVDDAAQNPAQMVLFVRGRYRFQAMGYSGKR
jgi:hypothetical protein